MNLNKIFAIILMFAVMFCAMVFLNGSISAQTTAQTSAGSAAPSFPETKDWNKVDKSLQDAWLAAMKENDPDRRFDCFVRVQAPFGRGDKSFLISKGFIVQMVVGNIASGHLTAKDLQSVAALPFVRSIRLATR